MKEYFSVMTSIRLEDFFVRSIVPEVRSTVLANSRKNPQTGLSTREHLGLVLLSYLMNSVTKTSDHVPALGNEKYDDGAVAYLPDNSFSPVEQVYVYEGKWDWNLKDGITESFRKKNRGESYIKDYHLLCFCNSQGDVNDKMLGLFSKETDFDQFTIMGPNGKSEFSYSCVTSIGGKRRYYSLEIDADTGVHYLR